MDQYDTDRSVPTFKTSFRCSFQTLVKGPFHSTKPILPIVILTTTNAIVPRLHLRPNSPQPIGQPFRQRFVQRNSDFVNSTPIGYDIMQLLRKSEFNVKSSVQAERRSLLRCDRRRGTAVDRRESYVKVSQVGSLISLLALHRLC